ncbi:MAG TPA: redoxin domain-containing protein [Verrucomicrobiota bacterium]|nr:redoxin domain-containing protein [Verrucomicrobiota bacterium]
MNRHRQIVRLATLLALVCSWPSSAKAGDAPLRITDIDGRIHEPLALGKTKAVVLVFVLRDCPVSNVYAPEMTRIHKEYSRKGVAIFLVHPDRDTDTKAARAHAKEYKLSAPLVLDHDHKLVRRAEAVITPEAAVFDAKGRLVYRGRIDNLYADYGKKRFNTTRRELRETLDALLAGKPMTKRTTKAVGCYIDFSNDKKDNK